MQWTTRKTKLSQTLLLDLCLSLFFLFEIPALAKGHLQPSGIRPVTAPAQKELVKILISNHKLMIETGRYNQTPKNDRFFPVCNPGQIIEGTNFFFSCIVLVQSMQSQGKNFTIKSNIILSILISYLAQN